VKVLNQLRGLYRGLRLAAANIGRSHQGIFFGSLDDIMMRTTVSNEPDLARQLEQRMATEGKGFTQVLNETLRRGFESAVGEMQAHYVVRSFSVPLAPGVDLARVNQLLDEDMLAPPRDGNSA
jgi:hypothetical protein